MQAQENTKETSASDLKTFGTTNRQYKAALDLGIMTGKNAAFFSPNGRYRGNAFAPVWDLPVGEALIILNQDNFVLSVEQFFEIQRYCRAYRTASITLGLLLDQQQFLSGVSSD